jgi:precorrin-6B methylase 2
MTRRAVTVGLVVCMLAGAGAGAVSAQEVYQPRSGQAGKDVVWVPTPPELVEKMLDMAEVTPKDVVMDLGSGDGRNIIAAARRGATAVGVEFNPDMVELSQRLAKEAGVDGKATFVQGDMYEADVSKASVLALFLLPANLDKLRDKFLAMPPGSRIVLNTFKVTEWEPDATEEVTDCMTWCTAYLVIVPARVEGTWTIEGGGELRLTQKFQVVTGTASLAAGSAEIPKGRLRGDQITLTIGETQYSGRVRGDRIEGTATTGTRKQTWTAIRARP